MSSTCAISTTSRRELSSFFPPPLQGKAPKEIPPILTEKLFCFLPGRVKELSAPLYIMKFSPITYPKRKHGKCRASYDIFTSLNTRRQFLSDSGNPFLIYVNKNSFPISSLWLIYIRLDSLDGGSSCRGAKDPQKQHTCGHIASKTLTSER